MINNVGKYLHVTFTMLANPTPTFVLATPTLAFIHNHYYTPTFEATFTSCSHPRSYSGTHGRDTAAFVTPTFKWRNNQSFDLN